MAQQRARSGTVGYEELFLGLLAVVAVCLTIFSEPVHAQVASWPDVVTIGTALKGGTYEAYGQGLAKVLRDKARIFAGVRETNGAEENLALLSTGDIQIGFTTLGAVLYMLKQQGDGADAKHIRALAPMYETAFHFVVLDRSPARTMKDLEGKSVGIGPHGGTTAFYVPLIMKALGINAKFVEGEWTALGNSLAGNEIDVLAAAGGTPFPALLDLGYQRKLRFIPLRVCPGSLARIAELSEHEADGSELEEGQRVAVEVLPVLGQSPAAVEPGNGSLGDPALRQRDEAFDLI